MKYHLFKVLTVIAIGLLATTQLRAANFITTANQTSGSSPNWNSAIWNSGAVVPTVGNSYEALSGALLRSPYSATAQPFNGDSLQLDSGASIRLKAYSSAITNIYTFGVIGIILNGGIIGNGDDQWAVINSPLTIAANSFIYAGPDATWANTTSGAYQGFRTYSFNGGLSGSDGLTFANAVLYNNPQVNANVGVTPNFIFNGNGSAYTGTIYIEAGWVQAGSANAFQGDVVVAGGNASNGVNGPAMFGASVSFSSPGCSSFRTRIAH